MHLEDLGWNAELARTFSPLAAQKLVPGRIVAEHRAGYELLAEAGALAGELSGKLRHESPTRPGVGDWVALRPGPFAGRATVDALLPRRTCLSRKAAGGKTEEQVIAANVDAVWLVTGLDLDLNERRIERYLTVAWESGAQPAIVLTKADAFPDVRERRAAVELAAPGVVVHVVSAHTGLGLEALEAELVPGRTVALVGSSGVGKSTLVNRLLGAELQRVQPIAPDGRGQHTTTARRLLLRPRGGLLIDTPGMRELQVWEGAHGISESFPELADRARACRFRDCRHEAEPGCAVLSAVESGELPVERLTSYRKLRREISFVERKQDARARAQANRNLRSVMKKCRESRLADDI